MTAQQIAALLQLSSPSLPIGGYSYSQGLESAIELGLVTDETSTLRWIHDQLTLVMCHCEAPVWSCLYQAFAHDDDGTVRNLNDWFLASRETHELLQETQQMGWSLLQLAESLQWCSPARLALMTSLPATALPCIHAGCSQALQIPHDAGLTAYLFSWLENQVMAAMKTVPLGQLAGQRLLQQISAGLGPACDQARNLAAQKPLRLRTFAPQYSIVAARHETQYSRLFRS